MTTHELITQYEFYWKSLDFYFTIPNNDPRKQTINLEFQRLQGLIVAALFNEIPSLNEFKITMRYGDGILLSVNKVDCLTDNNAGVDNYKSWLVECGLKQSEAAILHDAMKVFFCHKKYLEKESHFSREDFLK